MRIVRRLYSPGTLGGLHDEADCQMSIAEFMAEQGLQQDSEDG
jgi:hypothetical protein